MIALVRRSVLGALLAVALAGSAGCQLWPGSASGTDDPAQLGSKLRDVLAEASGGKGPDFFKLPASDDLAAIPQDPQNPLTAGKVELGKCLYHETAAAASPRYEDGKGTYSCASCHHVAAGFQANVRQSLAEGGEGFGKTGEGRKPSAAYLPRLTENPCAIDAPRIRTMSALHVAYQPNALWNGQFGARGVNLGTEARWKAGTPKEKNTLGYDGAEIQAIAGQDVHHINGAADDIKGNSRYQSLFAAAFPELAAGERVTKVNAGLAIAAYERTLLANQAPFQRFLRGDAAAMTAPSLRGGILFFGTAGCVACHTGPNLAAMRFDALGLKNLAGSGIIGEEDWMAVGAAKGRGDFTGRAQDLYKFKVPQLYNLADSPFYGHGGSITSLAAFVAYLNEGRPENAAIPAAQLAREFKPLGLTSAEMADLTAFLADGLRDANLARYLPESLPSGKCYPNNDTASRRDLGC